jgi:hypothetical protein
LPNPPPFKGGEAGRKSQALGENFLNTGFVPWCPERDWFSLKDQVELGRKNDRSDVLKVQSILGESGHYDLERTDGPTSFVGSDFDQSIKDFQRDNGLEADGWLKPNGPTIL